MPCSGIRWSLPADDQGHPAAAGVHLACHDGGRKAGTARTSAAKRWLATAWCRLRQAYPILSRRRHSSPPALWRGRARNRRSSSSSAGPASHLAIQESSPGSTSTSTRDAQRCKQRSHLPYRCQRRSPAHWQGLLLVNWLEIEIVTRRQCHSIATASYTDLPFGLYNVRRTRRPVAAPVGKREQTFNVLKTKATDIEHHFGHEAQPCRRLATLNPARLRPFTPAATIADNFWRNARQKLPPSATSSKSRSPSPALSSSISWNDLLQEPPPRLLKAAANPLPDGHQSHKINPIRLPNGTNPK